MTGRGRVGNCPRSQARMRMRCPGASREPPAPRGRPTSRGGDPGAATGGAILRAPARASRTARRRACSPPQEGPNPVRALVGIGRFQEPAERRDVDVRPPQEIGSRARQQERRRGWRKSSLLIHWPLPPIQLFAPGEFSARGDAPPLDHDTTPSPRSVSAPPHSLTGTARTAWRRRPGAAPAAGGSPPPPG
jgi:hypothetical protein